ncbi:MAG TPA: twin transmembrane helix small protein [Gammaproteobacteria bacterium]
MDLILIAMFVAVLTSLAVALVFLVRPGRRSSNVVNALTVRVGLSVLLFVLLMIAWYTGLIEPHGLQPAAPPPHP